jgi:hypothetical protein
MGVPPDEPWMEPWRGSLPGAPASVPVPFLAAIQNRHGGRRSEEIHARRLAFSRELHAGLEISPG